MTKEGAKAWSNGELAHLALRVVLGVNIAAHGLARIGHVGAFVAKSAPGFDATLLPRVLVVPFLWATPFLELALGFAMLLGLRLRVTLFAGAVMMAALTLGSSLQQSWDVVGLQLVYGLAYYVLLARADDARLKLTRI